MIDTLVHCLGQTSDDLPYPGLREREYAVVTLHRPSNVDRRETLQGVLKAFQDVSRRLTLVMPLHPRTLKRIEEFGLGDKVSAMGRRAIVTGPVGYLEMLRMVRSARMVITDSGGIQEETTYLGVPCLTMRENTERPSTIELGTNVLVGCDHGKLLQEVDRVMAGRGKKGTIPPLWDGKASVRIVDTMLSAR
jgi:UDP-N-acetylglucosamine 2-epimerase (non-hydrolysing)